MTDKELKEIQEFAKYYFLKKYSGKDVYVQEIQSYVAIKYFKSFNSSKGDWKSFVIKLVEQEWSVIYKRDYKIHIGLTDEDGNTVRGKLKPTYIDDLKGKSHSSIPDDEDQIEAMQYQKGIEDVNDDSENDEHSNYAVELSGEILDSLLGNENNEPPTLPPDTDHQQEDYDESEDEYLAAFYKIQLSVGVLPEKNIPVSKKYFDGVPSYSIPALNSRRLAGSELISNIDYYKFQAWLDKDNTRYFQELALQQMMMQGSQMDELYKNYVEDVLLKGGSVRKRHEFPLVGAVLVSEDGDVVAGSYKGCNCNGYSGSIAEHCEYLLFKKILSEENISKAKGGSLYVTLEPCVSRVYKKIPCAIHCLESGIKNIYVGTFDPDKSVSWKGVDILKTGCYKFQKKDSFYSDKHGKELQEYFRRKGYQEEEDSLTHTFIISEPVNVFPFYPDLTLEIIKQNEEFVKHHNWHLFAS